MSDWQTRKLIEVFNFVPTGSHSRSEMTNEINANSVFNIHYGDIHTKYAAYVDFDRNNIPALLPSAKYRSQMLLKDGDLVVADASEDYDGVGASVEIRNIKNKRAVAGLHTYAMRDSSSLTVPGFRALLFRNPIVHRRMMQVSVYSKVFGVTKKSISDISLKIPPKSEQERIVAVLEVWDEYLELLDQKIALKERLKKGLMQQLLTGKKRLPGFTDEWKKIEVGELLSYEQPTKYIVDSTNYLNDGVPVLTANKSFILGYTQETEGVYRDNNVIIFDDFTMANKFVNFSFKVKSSAIKILKSASDDVDIKFVFERMQLIQTVIGEHKRNYISEYQFNAIGVPTIDEQNAIARISNKADEEMELLKNKRSELRLQKKYLLKSLISGTIRTPGNMQIKGVD